MISFANEKFYIFWHDQNGILVCFESYTQSTDEEILSGGHAFYNWKPRDRKYIGKFESSGGYTENGIHIGYCGLADRLITRLKNFKMHGKFVKPWAENRYLWLAHSGDTPVQFDADFNCEALNERKIKKLPPHVQTVIGQ